MAFIPPEIGFRVKNRFTYSEIHTFPGVCCPRLGRKCENFLSFRSLAVLNGNDHAHPLPDKPNLYMGLPRVLTISVEIQLAIGID
jgi:hypothetical protein